MILEPPVAIFYRPYSPMWAAPNDALTDLVGKLYAAVTPPWSTNRQLRVEQHDAMSVVINILDDFFEEAEDVIYYDVLFMPLKDAILSIRAAENRSIIAVRSALKELSVGCIRLIDGRNYRGPNGAEASQMNKYSQLWCGGIDDTAFKNAIGEIESALRAIVDYLTDSLTQCLLDVNDSAFEGMIKLQPHAKYPVPENKPTTLQGDKEIAELVSRSQTRILDLFSDNHSGYKFKISKSLYEQLVSSAEGGLRGDILQIVTGDSLAEPWFVFEPLRGDFMRWLPLNSSGMPSHPDATIQLRCILDDLRTSAIKRFEQLYKDNQHD